MKVVVNGNVNIGPRFTFGAKSKVNVNITDGKVAVAQDPLTQETASNCKRQSAEQVIKDLMEATDPSGKRIFVDKSQWYAVFRVFSEFLNYPQKMTDFCESMEKMGYADNATPCTYNTIKIVPHRLEKLKASVELWPQFSNISESYAKQSAVTSFLLKKFGFEE